MSEHRLRLGDATLRVTLAHTDGGTQVTVDDVAHGVARIASGPRQRHAGATTETVAFDVDGRPIRALVTRLRDTVFVAVRGRVFTFATGEAVAGNTAGRTGSGTTLAPMPGKVVAVLVREGDPVEIGQGLVVIEAMKMESTLVAEIAGTVKKVTVVAGDVVDGGMVLVEVDGSAAGDVEGQHRT